MPPKAFGPQVEDAQPQGADDFVVFQWLKSAFHGVPWAENLVRHVSVIIICTEETAARRWRESELWRQMKLLGMKVDILPSVCKMHPGYTDRYGQYQIVEQEMWSQATPGFIQMVKDNKASTGLAIAVSHKRALAYALRLSLQDRAKTLVIVLEEDVIPANMCLHHLLLTVRHFHTNENLKHTQLCTLTYGQEQAHLATRVMEQIRGLREPGIPGTLLKPDTFCLVKWPRRGHGDQPSAGYEWIGTGARALMYRGGLANYIVNNKVNNWFDKWLIEVLNEPWVTQEDTNVTRQHFFNQRQIIAAVAWPQCFSHPIDDGERMRGSERLHLESAANESVSKHICLDLSTKRYGLTNCVQTMLFYCHVAAQLGAGLVVRWPASRPGMEQDWRCIIRDDQESVDFMKSVWPSLAFFRIFTKDDGQFNPYREQRTGCLGIVTQNCEVQRGRNYLIDGLAQEKGWEGWESTLLTIAGNASIGFHDEWWNLLRPAGTWEMYVERCELLKAMRDAGTRAPEFVAVHVRRGDFRYLKCEKFIADRPDTPIGHANKITCGMSFSKEDKNLQDPAGQVPEEDFAF